MEQDLEERRALLLEAYNDTFCDTLERVRFDLEAVIRRLAEELARNLDSLLGCRLIVESRVKSHESFAEKIKRKGYLDTWDISDDIDSNQDLIRTALPDLIGLRLNCMFLHQEKEVYEGLKSVDLDLQLDFSASTKMRNGKDIYKVTGSYEWTDRQRYNFELQIKSYINNLWGEVEHAVKYKNRCYSVDEQLTRSVTDQTITVLEATDGQLQKLFKHSYDEDGLVKGLFCLYTKDDVATTCGTDILAEHYNRFFTLMLSEEYVKIRRYVSCALAGEAYEPSIITTDDCGESTLELANQLSTRYFDHCIDTLYHIASKLNNYKRGRQDFLIHLASVRLEETRDEFADDESTESDLFNDGKTHDETDVEAQIKYFDHLFEDYLLRGSSNGEA